MKPIIDSILALSISKKLTVFVLGTIFLFYDKVDSKEWLHLAMLYIGVQGGIDLIKEYLKK